MYKYKNYGNSTKTYYDVEFTPNAEKEVPGYINDPAFVRVYENEPEGHIVEFVQIFKITFLDYDDTLIQSKYVPKGEDPTVYPPEVKTPTRPDDDEYTYTFAGWVPPQQLVDKDATYKAGYTATPKD